MNKKKRQGKSEDILEDILHTASLHLKKWWKAGALLLALVVIAALAYSNYRNLRQAELQMTWIALSDLPQIHPMMTEEEAAKALDEIIENCHMLLTERQETEATPWVLLRLGNAYLQKREPGSATQILGRIKERHPDHYVYSLAIQNLAAAKEQAGDYEMAAITYRTIAEKEDGSPLRWIDAARNMELAGQRSRAIEAYEKAIRKSEADTEAISSVALAQHRLAVLNSGGQLLASPPELDSPVVAEEILPADQPDVDIFHEEPMQEDPEHSLEVPLEEN